MKSQRFRPRRYQLKKEAAAAVQKEHPWVFRDKVSTAAAIFPEGQWLELVDAANKIVGYGIYQTQGGVAIRVLRKGKQAPDLAWLGKQVEKALAKRLALRADTQGYRALNGENDGLPGIVLDVYNGVGVLQTYVPGVDSLGRYLAALAYQQLGLTGLIWKCPSKRKDSSSHSVRVLRGEAPAVTRFREGGLGLVADLMSGQKSGTFLDLRGLRRWLVTQDLSGQRVLNLFAYTGSAGLACCKAGAREVVNVDSAQASLDFGKAHHQHKAQKWLTADIFAWLKSLPAEEKFDLIVVDPPSMASKKDQVPKALAVYRRLYRSLRPHLSSGARMVACCCTSRITPGQFEVTVRDSLATMKRVEKLPMEVDHKPRFDEANYLKVLVFEESARAPKSASRVFIKDLSTPAPRPEMPPRPPRPSRSRRG